jgi:putative N-acetylmannosamine-6-phosphate epimerase
VEQLHRATRKVVILRTIIKAMQHPELAALADTSTVTEVLMAGQVSL